MFINQKPKWEIYKGSIGPNLYRTKVVMTKTLSIFMYFIFVLNNQRCSTVQSIQDDISYRDYK